ncbi:MAG: c-type cytochrome [Chloracidobacterium sp.]|nr:c-type cytochrome [Chloracidobacterium sp.]
MNKNKYLLMFSSLGVLLLLVVAAVSENYFKEWQAIQKTSSTSEGPLDQRLRQIVNPSMRKTDRCVTCHVGMASGEQITTGLAVGAPHKPVVHSPTEIGCTVCHGGQGQATTKEDAHGTVEFWSEPMLPAKYAYASCGTCHTPLNVPNINKLEAVRKTFERLDCYACHRIEDRGGTLRPGGVTGMEGPDLSHVGIKGYNKDWYAGHLEKSKQSTEGLWKNSFREISDADRESVRIFLETQMGASKLIEAKAQFNTVGCAGCHKVGNFGGDAGVELTRVGEKDPGTLNYLSVKNEHTLGNWIVQHFRSPVSTVPGSQMPILGLNDNQIDLLTMYMLSLRRRSLPDTYLPKDRVKAMRFGAREFASDGETIYTAVCTSCHGADGKGRRFAGLPNYPSITSQDFLELASDDFLLQTIRNGRPGRPMLPWGDRENGFTDDELRGVIAYIRQLGGSSQQQPDTKPQIWAKGDVTLGARLFTSNCSGCHGKTGEGADGPSLSNKIFRASVTDTYLVGIIGRGRRGTVMQGFANPSPVRRALTQAEIESIVVYIRSLNPK